MDISAEAIQKWSQELEAFEPQSWDRMPEIYLYMDQVLSYMEKQLQLFDRSGEGLLTSSMINNYVKAGVLPRPDRKKYAREHLAMLTMICMLKSSLSIPDISSLMNLLLKDSSEKEMYGNFCEAQRLAIEEVCSRVDSGTSGGRRELIRLAAELSIEAAMRRAAAERILSELSSEPHETVEES